MSSSARNSSAVRFARQVWSLWLTVSLLTLLAIIGHGLIVGLTFRAMAIAVALGCVLFALLTALAFGHYRAAGEGGPRLRPQEGPQHQDEDTVRLDS